MKFTSTKEFHEMRSQFERDLSNMPFYIGVKIVRADRENCPADVFYDNGNLNNLFQSYMFGYQFGKTQSL